MRNEEVQAVRCFRRFSFYFSLNRWKGNVVFQQIKRNQILFKIERFGLRRINYIDCYRSPRSIIFIFIYN